MTETSTNSQTPKSVRQKRILSIAAEQPDASFAQIADEVATATTDVVEAVLEQYGDPAEQPTASTQSSGETASPPGSHTTEEVASLDGGQPVQEPESSSIDATVDDQPSTPGPNVTEQAASTEQESASGQPDTTEQKSTTKVDTASEPTATPDADDLATAVTTLTAKQRETLAAIRADPDATQRELADILGVTAPTVSNRVNGIPGFEWSDRCSFIAAVLDVADAETIEDLEAVSALSDGGADSPKPDTAANASDIAESTTEDAADEAIAESGVGAGEPAAEEAPDSSDEPVASDTEPATSSAVIQPADLESLLESLEDLTAQLAAEETGSPASDSQSDRPFAETELLHKVIHACMEAETISEEEELEILDRLI